MCNSICVTLVLYFFFFTSSTWLIHFYGKKCMFFERNNIKNQTNTFLIFMNVYWKTDPLKMLLTSKFIEWRNVCHCFELRTFNFSGFINSFIYHFTCGSPEIQSKCILAYLKSKDIEFRAAHILRRLKPPCRISFRVIHSMVYHVEKITTKRMEFIQINYLAADAYSKKNDGLVCRQESIPWMKSLLRFFFFFF